MYEINIYYYYLTYSFDGFYCLEITFSNNSSRDQKFPISNFQLIFLNRYEVTSTVRETSYQLPAPRKLRWEPQYICTPTPFYFQILKSDVQIKKSHIQIKKVTFKLKKVAFKFKKLTFEFKKVTFKLKEVTFILKKSRIQI